jgi:hypothetical protein
MVWPVYLKYDGGMWNTTTNGWKEWSWDENGPKNKRLARFFSVVKLYETYNMTFESQPPSDMRFQIQERAYPDGVNSDWVIVRIYYPVSNMIEVLNYGVVVKPNTVIDGVYKDLNTQTNMCGANNFFYENGTISFVVTGDHSCQVRLRLTSYVQVSATFIISVSEFYENDGETSFLTNICAFLKIDTSTLKILSINEFAASSRRLLAEAAITIDMVITIPKIDEDGNILSEEEIIEKGHTLRDELVEALEQHLIELKGSSSQ